MGRRIAFLTAALLTALLSARPAASAPAAGAHPLFDDGGTLRWHTTFDDAARAARAQGRVIFMDMGRRVCAPCQRLVNSVLPDPRVRARLARIAVGLAVDADRPDARANALRIRHLPGQTVLPMTAFLTPDGTWITGASGALDVAGFLVHLERAEAAQRRLPAAAPTLPARNPAASAPSGTLPPPSVALRPGSLPLAPTSVPARPAPPRAAPPRPLPPTSAPVPVPTPALAPAPRRATGTLGAEARISCCVEHNADFLRPAERAAAAGRWGEVLRLTRASTDAQDQVLARRAHDWGEALLTLALADALAGRTQVAVSGLERVRRELAGDTLALDAERGLDALETLRDLAQLSDSTGALANTLRRNKHDELRSTRWARLFPSA